MANRLSREASPYLKKHAEQAIDWRPWNQNSFSFAQCEDKPILISIGYLACFWCHVMAEESFADPRVIDLINRDFVAIKVDREELPDVDRSVLDAIARLGGRTGWPATAFMTPRGDVFAGGSYYPPTPRHGLPGFLDVLEEASRRYRQRDGLHDIGPRDRKDAAAPSRSPVADIESYAGYLSDRLLENIDGLYGGFGLAAPRFPQVFAHQLLWRRYVMSGSQVFGNAVVESLSRICRSALRDHVGGGFHRYCVDEAWMIPHFEKMLYDNAQLLELLSWVWRGVRSALFKDCAEGVVAWATREMLLPGAGFASSISAHSGDGLSEIEDAGRFYRWDPGEIQRELGADAEFFLKHYEISQFGTHPAGALLQTEATAASGADRARIEACLARLLARRGLRTRPARDDKVLADWNGLMIVALIEAGSAFERTDWLALARRVFDELTDRLNEGSTLRHCAINGLSGPEGFLEDYAAMARAALRLYEAFGKSRYLDLAVAWVEVLDAGFWDIERGGYFMTSAREWRPGGRVRTITESSLPSGNAFMIGVLARMHELTGDGRYLDRAERLVAAFHADIVRHGLSATMAVNNVLTLGQFVRIAVFGQPSLAETRDLLRAALDCSLPDRMVLGPGSGAGPLNSGPPQAQVCIGTACLLPLHSAEALRELTAPGGLARAAGGLFDSSP